MSAKNKWTVLQRLNIFYSQHLWITWVSVHYLENLSGYSWVSGNTFSVKRVFEQV